MTSLKNKSGVCLVGSGSAIPKQCITNAQLASRVETSDEWISTRTGIQQRFIVGPKDSLLDLATLSSKNAIEMAGWHPEEVDLIVLATSTPDDLFGLGPKLQAKLGAKNAVAFDLTAACSGFLFGLVTASQFLQNNSYKKALVIGADQLSSWIDWDDRRSCVLFGDGAGTIALQSSNNFNDLLGFKLKSDGLRGDCLNISTNKEYLSLVEDMTYQKGTFSSIKMNGQEVYKFAIREVPLILDELLQTFQLDPNSVDWLLLHQANQRILDAVAERFQIPKSKVLSNLSKYGNTSAATIPLMLDEAVREGKVLPGNLIASSGFGAGLSWGAALFNWRGPI